MNLQDVKGAWIITGIDRNDAKLIYSIFEETIETKLPIYAVIIKKDFSYKQKIFCLTHEEGMTIEEYDALIQYSKDNWKVKEVALNVFLDMVGYKKDVELINFVKSFGGNVAKII